MKRKKEQIQDNIKNQVIGLIRGNIDKNVRGDVWGQLTMPVGLHIERQLIRNVRPCVFDELFPG